MKKEIARLDKAFETGTCGNMRWKKCATFGLVFGYMAIPNPYMKYNISQRKSAKKIGTASDVR